MSAKEDFRDGRYWKWFWYHVFPQTLGPIVAVLLFLLGASCALFFAGPGGAPLDGPAEPAPLVTLDDGSTVPEGFSTGWVADPEEADLYADTLPFGSFRETPAFQAKRATDADEVFLWEAGRKVLGKLIPTENQGGVGSCVSFGTNMAIQTSTAVMIAEGTAARHDYRDLVEEITYGGSRVEIGGGRIRGDGSIGAWAAKFVKDYGVLDRAKHGKYDLSRYSESTCREFGRDGVPDDLEDTVRQFPVKEVTRVGSWEEVKAAIANGYPIAVCSNQGFSNRRDSDGFARPQGQWAHCMSILGIRGGNRPGAFILNSWGEDWISGPKYPADAPEGGFWADAKVIDRMARQGDTWAFSGFQGFPRREIDWFALGTRRQPPVFADASRDTRDARIADLFPIVIAP